MEFGNKSNPRPLDNRHLPDSTNVLQVASWNKKGINQYIYIYTYEAYLPIAYLAFSSKVLKWHEIYIILRKSVVHLFITFILLWRTSYPLYSTVPGGKSEESCLPVRNRTSPGSSPLRGGFTIRHWNDAAWSISNNIARRWIRGHTSGGMQLEHEEIAIEVHDYTHITNKAGV